MVLKVLTFFGVVTLIIALVIGGPLMLIWALNTLFGLAIPITLKTWAAALILEAPFASSYSSKGD